MSHTHKNQKSIFDDDYKGKRKHPNHANNHKTHGMKIINQNIFENIEEITYNDDKYDYEQSTI